MNRVLKNAGLGFLLGIAILNMITAFQGAAVPVSAKFLERMGSMRAAMMVQTFLCGVYGAICMGTTILYEEDRMPLALVSLLHCMICIVPFIPMALFLGWFTEIKDAFVMMAIQCLAYFMVWLMMYIRYRMEIKELNEIQKRILEKTESIV